MSLRVELIGGARLTHSEGALALERKTAGLLSYVALSKATVRTRIAGLLWPESPERTARNNLAQTIRRLHRAAGRSLLAGDTAIALEPDVDVDVVHVEVLVQRGRYGEAVAKRGALLEGLDYDDCPEFESWLAGQRERVRRALQRASAAEAQRLEDEGDLVGALDITHLDLAADPLDERAHRKKMRLLYLRGDVAAALAAFDECAAVLDSELGTKPHPDTAALAADIKKGRGSLTDRSPASRRAPLAVRPPLTGRADLWRRLERAWERGQGVFLVGDGGVGKTRLMLDFATSKGAFSVFEGRPGDFTVPYATHARVFRRMLERLPEPAPDSVREELSRIIPELGKAPATSLDKLRFFEAKVQAIRLAIQRGMNVVCFDDLQFFDSASLEALEFVFAKLHSGELTGLRTLFSMRPATHILELERRLQHAKDAGLIEVVSVSPLDATEIEELLAATEPSLAARSADIARLTAGNPFFIVELVKSFRSGDYGVDGAIERGERAKEILKRRLEMLSPGALRLARLVAIADTEFDVGLAADVLEMPAVDLAEPLGELGEAGIVEDGRFVHDVLEESVAAAIPRAVKAFIHERVAQYLVRRNAAPERIAHHYLESARDAEAAPWLLLAAEHARQLSRMTDAIGLYEHAARIFELAGERPRAFEALYAAAMMMGYIDLGERFDAIVAGAERLASTDGQRALALVCRGEMESWRGRFDECRRAATEAAILAERAGERSALVDAWQIRFVADSRNNSKEAPRTLERLTSLLRERGTGEDILTAHWFDGNLGVIEDRHEQAILDYRSAIAALEKWGQRLVSEVPLLAYIARSEMILGRARDAEQTIGRAASHVEAFSAPVAIDSLVRLTSADCGVVLERFELALALLRGFSQEARASRQGSAEEAMVRAGLWAALQRRDQALEALAACLPELTKFPMRHAEAILTMARLTGDISEQDARLVAERGTRLQRARLDLQRPHESATEALTLARRALAEIEGLGAHGHAAQARARIAEHQASLGNNEEAIASADHAVELATRYPPVSFSMGEVLAVRARVFASLGHSEAERAREAASTWLQRARDSLGKHAT